MKLINIIVAIENLLDAEEYSVFDTVDEKLLIRIIEKAREDENEANCKTI